MPETTNPTLPDLLDITQVAKHLGPRHIRRLVHEKRIPYVKWGHLIRFDPADISVWIAANRRPQHALPDVAPRRG